MTDVVIIGAGMAGLSAGLELKSRGVDFLILEATSQAGGRAATLTTPSGTPVDLGAHWLHGGENSPVKTLLERYNIAYTPDAADRLTIYENGEVRRDDSEWLEDLLDPDKTEGIKNGKRPDCSLPDLAKDAHGRKVLEEFGLMWNGLDPPDHPSALEFLTDENTVGGLQPAGGIGVIIDAMTAEIGDRILYKREVKEIVTTEGSVEVRSADGETWSAEQVLFTGSLGVLTSGAVTFDPPFSQTFRDHLGGLMMGHMNKIVVELEPAFFETRGIRNDTALELLDGAPPHFCHARSAGTPLISLYVTGRQATAIEAFSAAEALGYLRTVLEPVKELAGFEDYIVGDLLVSHWSGHPFARGAYSACRPGAKRSGPWREGRVCFCGDTFDPRFPASLAGAFSSGQAAAKLIG